MDRKGRKEQSNKKCQETVNLIDLDWRMPQSTTQEMPQGNDRNKKQPIVSLLDWRMPQTNANDEKYNVSTFLVKWTLWINRMRNELSELEKMNQLKKEMDDLQTWTKLELLKENGKINDYLREQIVAKIQDLDHNLTKLAKNCSKGLKRNGKEIDQMKMEIAKFLKQNMELKERIEEKNFEDGAQILAFNGKFDQMREEMDFLAKKVQKLEMENLALKLGTNFCDGMEKEEIYRKWNAHECGQNLQIHSNQRKITHIGNVNEWNTVRAEMPILMDWRMHENEKQFIACYFEVQILHKANCNSHICIGYCGQTFPLKGVSICCKKIGSNYVGISSNDNIEINGVQHFFGSGDSMETDFAKGDVIGCGLVGFPTGRRMKCFSTCNGILLGAEKLHPKFDEIPLFPALSMFDSTDCIEANFGQDAWLFNPINYKFQF